MSTSFRCVYRRRKLCRYRCNASGKCRRPGFQLRLFSARRDGNQLDPAITNNDGTSPVSCRDGSQVHRDITYKAGILLWAREGLVLFVSRSIYRSGTLSVSCSDGIQLQPEIAYRPGILQSARQDAVLFISRSAYRAGLSVSACKDGIQVQHEGTNTARTSLSIHRDGCLLH